MSENELGCVERPPFFYFYQLRCYSFFHQRSRCCIKLETPVSQVFPFQFCFILNSFVKILTKFILFY